MARRSTAWAMAWALAPAAWLAACTGVGPERAFLGAGKVNPAGANHLIQFARDPIPSRDLAILICPAMADEIPAAKHADADRPDVFVRALACFHRDAAAAPETGERMRNDVQHVIMLRSEQNCGLWKTYLQRGGAMNRGTFNILSVLTGGAGAVVEGPAASILAAVSGAAAGTGAAIDAAMLHGLTEGLIFPRVDAVREAQRIAIEGHQRDDLVAYSLMRALSDAVRYHAACNMSAALSADTPGAQFGAQIRTLTEVAAGVRRASVAVAGVGSVSAVAPTADDIRKGATFLTTDGEVLTVADLPVTAGRTGVDYLKVSSGQATDVAGEPIADFAARIAGTVLVRAGK